MSSSRVKGLMSALSSPVVTCCNVTGPADVMNRSVSVAHTVYCWKFVLFVSCGAAAPRGAMASSFLRFLYHTQRRITVGRTPLDEWSARRRDLYLTTHNSHNRQTSMPRGGIRTHDLSKRAAADLRLRPRGYWDRLLLEVRTRIIKAFEIHFTVQSV